jgi:hypothetical protein
MRERKEKAKISNGNLPVSFPFSFPSKEEFLVRMLLHLEEGTGVSMILYGMVNTMWQFSK